LLSQLAGEWMLKQRSGKIINTASLLSFFGGYHAAAYAASKGGIAQLTKSLAVEWGPSGINVNAIAPGYMATRLNADLLQDETRVPAISARIPAGRWGTPDDVKGVVVFLASRASDYINGVVVPVDGGHMVR
jgi:2-deoxy-D-gluconate 3-dehydrogenase